MKNQNYIIYKISFRNEIEYKRDEFYEKLINDIKEDQRLSRFTSLNSQVM